MCLGLGDVEEWGQAEETWHLTKIRRHPSFGKDSICLSTFLGDNANLISLGGESREEGVDPDLYASGTFISYLCSRFPSASLLPHCSSGSLVAPVPLPYPCSAHSTFCSHCSAAVQSSSTGLVSHNFERYFFPLFLIFCLYLSHLAAVIGDKGQGSRRLTKGNTCFCLLHDLLLTPLLLSPVSLGFYRSHMNRTAEYTDLHWMSAKTLPWGRREICKGAAAPPLFQKKRPL